MSYVLLYRQQAGTPEVLAMYATRGAARRAMRVSNRNAGWSRSTRTWTSWTEMEWGEREGVYDYAPYVIMTAGDYTRKYVEVAAC